MQRKVKEVLLSIFLVFFRILTLNFTRNLSYFWLKIEAKRPRGFRRKLLFKMAFDRRPILTATADKIAVRDFVKVRVGEQILTTSSGVMRPGDSFDFRALPREFVAKVNHGSGGNVIVWSGAPLTATIPRFPSLHGWVSVVVHPDNVDEHRLQKLVNYWLSRDYSWGIERKYPEWVYEDIPRGVLLEELLVGPDGKAPVDYKFFCFDGEVKMIECHSERFSQHQCSLMTPDWKRIEARYPSLPFIDPTPVRPLNLDSMIDAAEKLSAGFDFVRVDLFDIENRIVFGELTHYDSGGTGKFTPREFDEILGGYWNLPDYSTIP